MTINRNGARALCNRSWQLACGARVIIADGLTIMNASGETRESAGERATIVERCDGSAHDWRGVLDSGEDVYLSEADVTAFISGGV